MQRFPIQLQITIDGKILTFTNYYFKSYIQDNF